MNTVQHRWLINQNKQLDWCDMDSENRWQDNMQNPSNRKLLELNGWDQLNIINYKFNSHGFRCEEFTQDPGIVTLGCSFTGGVGLPVDVIWPTIVARALNLKLWNLGVGAASMDSCFRILNHYISKLNIKLVCFLTTDKNRFEMFLPNGNSEWAVPTQPNITDYQKMWYQNEQNSTQNYLRNSMAIRHLCQIYNVKIIEKDSLVDLLKIPCMVESGKDRVDRARDLGHPGVLSHRLCADLFLNAA